MISVDICSPDELAAETWRELASRSSSNVFIHPAAISAATETSFADVRMLLAWRQSDGVAMLVGLWALRLRRIAPLWPLILEALPYEYAFLSNPMVDPVFVAEVMPAFLAAIANSPLPNLVSLRDFDAEAPSYDALVAAATANGRAPVQLASDARPMVSRDGGVKASGSTRKKLRQDWRRLAALGAVEVVNDRAPDAVRAAFEVFLAMEFDGWKGEQGTALLCDADSAAFVRRLIGDLADQSCASVALLRVGDTDIAAQVLMYGGATAYTWKTAYVADYGKYSPGAVLVDRVTEQLLATPGIEAIDSCSTSDGFMAQLWSGRRTMVELLLQAGPGGAGMALERVRRRGYHWLRGWRNRLRDRARRSRLPVRPGQEATSK